MASFVGPKISGGDNNLVFHLDASNPKSYPGSGTTWFDLSGRGYNATLYNSPVFSNGSFQIRSASAQYASATFDEGVLKASSQTGSWTIECWFKNISPPSSGESFVAGRIGCHGGIYLHPNSTNTDLYTAIKTASCWTGAVATSIITLIPNRIVHSVMTYNNGSVKTYINGSLLNTSTLNYATYGTQPYGNDFNIGGIGNLSNYSTNIDVYSVRAYNRELLAVEVDDNFQANRDKYGI